MDANSEGENPNNKPSSSNKTIGNAGEGPSKPKRQMKTPFQLEILEKAYAQEMYPTEGTRVELSEKLGLTDRQLQMWFCHRRLKDKKETPAKKPRKETPLRDSPAEELLPVVGEEPVSDYGSGPGSGSGSSPFAEPRKVGLDDVPTRRYFESSPRSILELRAIACVEAQLGEPLREDGPILGVEFDPLPPGAFGAPIAPLVQQQRRLTYPYEAKLYDRQDAKPVQASARALNEYQFLQEQSNVRSDTHGHVSQSPYRDVPIDTLRQKVSPFAHGDEPLLRVNGTQSQISRVRHFSHEDKKEPFLTPHRDETSIPQRDPLKHGMISAQSINHQILGIENPDVLPEAQIFNSDMDVRMERKRKSDEARIAREVEAHESRIRKELEKQDILRRKNEERVMKEMERLDRERRKEEERLLRERQREEERAQREQRRELERREKILQKEYLRAEKRRQKEELRREKEAEKRKAAIEKAAARKIFKKALDLIEDDQLELMELSAVSKGFPIAHLDYESLQSLDSFKGSLSLFPPETVELKKPFAIQPWVDSEENIGNVLMVWRFLITFADVLGLWPFTLEEFIQALHDYDSRLLGEIHVALLRLIIKDIEDVARTPSGGLGTNQYSAVNPEGGHPKIVEGAYVWGFDILNWQRHLSPLTWTEIFRQMALAAGFGPQLKKRSAAWTYLGDIDGKGCEDTISTLRNGSAAENAFTFMREKGLLAPRRSRHRLTPGTVKFAAFHVLSLEGEKGLTVLELADKIQKSGLRDLTTSKTPEASISVALTRDQKLFERIAPSTYCVRAAFRKDPADAEAILSAARKKIRMFESGFSTEDADDAERDEDSEGDVEEDPEVDDLAAPLGATKSIEQLNEMNIGSGSGNDDVHSNFSLIRRTEHEKGISASPLNENNCVTDKLDVISEDVGVNYVNVNDMEIDETKQVESWIQGLAEGEYSHLSVEERLNALVALVGVANEGNSIRVVLEERLEAANALKKQMWAEAQSDRSRLKEDIMSRLDLTAFSKAELQVGNSSMNGMQSMTPLLDNYTKDALLSTAEKQKGSAHDTQNQLEGVSAVIQDASMNPDNFLAQQHLFTSKRSRSQLKAYIGHTAEETYAYRSLPLGQDRRRNRYWQFVASASKNDPCSGRIFVELHNGKWRVIESVEAFDALVSSLDSRGIRESHLCIMLQKIETSFKGNVKMNLHSDGTGCLNEREVKETNTSSSQSADSRSSILFGPSSDALDTSSWFRIQRGKNETERYREFQKWMWKECFSSSTLAAFRHGKRKSLQLLTTCDSCMDTYFCEDVHCHFCHHTFSETDEKLGHLDHAIQCEAARKSAHVNSYTIDSLPPRIKLLKALLAFIEVSVPSEVLESFWTESFRRTWGMKLKNSSSNEEILQLLILFESAIRRDRLSSNFEKTKDVLGAPSMTGHGVYDSTFPESVPVFPWIPKTSAAVTLRIFELEASIIYIPHEKAEALDDKPLKVYMKLPSRFSSHENEEAEFKIEQRDEHIAEEKLSNLRSRRTSHKRSRCSRDQSYSMKLQKRAPGPKLDGSKRNTRDVVNLSLLRQQGKRTNGHSSGRGRRTVRKRRVEKMVGESTLLSRMSGMFGSKTYGGSERNVIEQEWSGLKFEADLEGADNSNSREAAGSDDNVDVGEYDQGDWGQNLDATPNGWTGNSMPLTDDDDNDDGDASGNENVSLDINRIGDVRNEDSDGDIGMSDGSDDVPSHMGNEEGTDSIEDDYSD